LKTLKIIGLTGFMLAVAFVLAACGCFGNDNNQSSGEFDLTYWVGIAIGDGTSDIQQVPFVQALEEATGIRVDYRVAPSGIDNATQQFNLLIASGNLPDIIEFHWARFPRGGPTGAIETETIISLNEILESGRSPHYRAVIESMPHIHNVLTTANGDFYHYAFIRSDPRLTVFNGPFLRADWLAEVNLEPPVTIDEWETVLIAFRDQMGARAPLVILPNFMATSAFMGAFGVKQDFYLSYDLDDVVFGPIQPGYREFLELFNRWYTERLFDPNFTQTTVDNLRIFMIDGTTGATVHAVGGGMNTIMTMVEADPDSDPAFDLVATQYPVLNRGDRVKFSSTNFQATDLGAAITTRARDVDLAVRFLDFGYSPEGQLLFNFGIPGITYNMIDGFPTYTDYVLRNPAGLARAQVLSLYSRVSASPTLHMFETQQGGRPQGEHAQNVWSDTDELKFRIPPGIMTVEENNEFNRIMIDVQTYVDERFVTFIKGTDSLDQFDRYVQNLRNMGLDRATEILRTALRRHNARN